MELVDQTLFDKLQQEIPEVESPHNYCPQCNIPMMISGIDYQCAECGLIREGEVESVNDRDNCISGRIKISTGSARGKYYTVTGDYTRLQKQSILTQLEGLQRDYIAAGHTPYPKNV